MAAVLLIGKLRVRRLLMTESAALMLGRASMKEPLYMRNFAMKTKMEPLKV